MVCFIIISRITSSPRPVLHNCTRLSMSTSCGPAQAPPELLHPTNHMHCHQKHLSTSLKHASTGVLSPTHGRMGTGIPAGGSLRYRKGVPQQLGDMQLPCYQTRESPSSGKCSIFCYRLTYISKMFSMHTKHFYWGGIAVILMDGASSMF